MWPSQHYSLLHRHPSLNEPQGEKRFLIRSGVPLPTLSYDDLAKVPGIELAPFAIPPMPLIDPALDLGLSHDLFEGGEIHQSVRPAELLLLDTDDLELPPVDRLRSTSPRPVAQDFFVQPSASKPSASEEYECSSTEEDSEGSFQQAALQNRHQPHRKAKDGHPFNLKTGQDLQMQLLNKAFLDTAMPMSPRVAESKATQKAWSQPQLAMVQKSDALNAEAMESAPIILNDAEFELKKARLALGLSQSGSPLTELAKRRLELSLKKECMLQDYANGQTDAAVLMQQHDISKRNLTTWVDGFRRQQAKWGLKLPDLVWPLRQPFRNAQKRNMDDAPELNPELNKDEDYQPSLERLTKKSRKQQAQNPFYRLRGEGGRFASFSQEIAPTTANSTDSNAQSEN